MGTNLYIARQWPALLAFSLGLLLCTWHVRYLPMVEDINGVSLLSEGLIASLLFVLMHYAARKSSGKLVDSSLMLGLLLLLMAFLTDTLDEVFKQPLWVTVIFEDASELLGLVLLIIGVHQWLKQDNKRHVTLQKFAAYDALTGLFMRRPFQEKAQSEFDRYQRSKSEFAILMVDIDHFKLINDQHGHAAGDLVLKQLAGELKRSIRKTDWVARWGGEEFIFLLLDVDEGMCFQLAENIRKKVEGLSTPIGAESIQFTVSIGATLSHKEDTSYDHIINRADKLLYRAKRKGRNRVEINMDEE